MALDPIWQQQLTLVSYGNAYLKQANTLDTWLNHPIFDQHSYSFRNLNSQQLLAPHFQIWLEHLKKQGCQLISLHSSEALLEQKNPNAQVELVPYAHFIVSHHKKSKTAWIFGKELALWYSAEEDYIAPETQQSLLRHETLWQFELPEKLHKRIDSDLSPAHWQDIHHYMQQELFQHPLAQTLPLQTLQAHFYGLNPQPSTAMALLPEQYSAPYAHQSLQRLAQLSKHIQQQIQHPQNAQGQSLTAEQLLNLRHFSQKIDDLYAKLITKVANHYQSAQITLADLAPLDHGTTTPPASTAKPTVTATSSATKNTPAPKNTLGVIKLIIITVAICFLAYYFGL